MQCNIINNIQRKHILLASKAKHSSTSQVKIRGYMKAKSCRLFEKLHIVSLKSAKLLYIVYILPCSASTVRDRKRSSITLNKNSTRAFQRAINQGSTPPLTSSNGDKLPKFVVFWTISTIKDEKSAAKCHYVTVSSKVIAQSIAFRAVSLY